MAGPDHGIPKQIEELSFRHLQLPPNRVRDLEKRGLYKFADLFDAPSQTTLDVPEDLTSLAFERAMAAARHVTDAGIDWPGFWREPSTKLFWMAMHFSNAELHEDRRGLSLDSLTADMGAILNIPRSLGFQTLGDLISVYELGTRPWPGFGIGKTEKLGVLLQKIVEKGDRCSAISENLAVPAQAELPPDVLTWDIDVLGLGGASEKLRRNDCNTLASLQRELNHLARLPGIGSRTVQLARERMSCLAQAVDDGEVNIEKLAALQELELIPSDERLQEAQLYDTIRSVIRSVSQADGSDAALLILRHRICTGGSDEITLEDIAGRLPVKVTRERVRQIEKRILKRSATLFLSPFPVMGSVLVRPALKDKFRILAKALEDRDQISPDDLAVMISEEWECSLVTAVRVLPMVMAIIEGTARTFAELRQLVDAPPELLRPLLPPARDWAAQNVGAGRSLAKMLDKLSIENLEDLRRAWIAGCAFGHHKRYLQSVLFAISDPGSEDESLPDRIAQITGVPLVPFRKGNWADYVGTLPEDVATMIGAGTFWQDAEAIFRQRTSVLPSERTTMEALGSKLGRLGVTVKRTETETLARLALAILDGRGGHVQCIIRPDWIEMWRDLQKLHERFSGDQKTFGRSVESLYGVTEGDLTMAMPTIWAILTGLPTRQSFGKARVEARRTMTPLAPVKLAGFRSVH